MASPDLSMLVDMGFDQERAAIALKKSGSRMFSCANRAKSITAR